MTYYGTRLSENLSRREPEGYLLCLNVPVARCGVQGYLAEELGLPGGGELIPVYRPEEEVFAPECVASFEGMPVTNDHPPEGVALGNIRELQKGHAHHVRRGTGKERDLLLADLIITDRELIDAILGGKREISCGYTYELSEEDGRYVQRAIRGNHVAVVDAGRAGHRVRIRDRRPAAPGTVNPTTTERRTGMKKKSIAKVLARMARDGDTESVAEILEVMLGEETPGLGAAGAESAQDEPETAGEAGGAAGEAEHTAEIALPEGVTVTLDSDLSAAILERLDRLIALLSSAAETPEAPAGDEDPAIEEMAQAVEAAMEAMNLPPNGLPEADEEAGTDPLSSVLEEGGGAREARVDDALHIAMELLAPVTGGISREKRKYICRELARRAHAYDARTRHSVSMDYRDLSAEKKKAADLSALGKRIMAARNINQRKGAA